MIKHSTNAAETSNAVVYMLNAHKSVKETEYVRISCTCNYRNARTCSCIYASTRVHRDINLDTFVSVRAFVYVTHDWKLLQKIVAIFFSLLHVTVSY